MLEAYARWDGTDSEQKRRYLGWIADNVERNNPERYHENGFYTPVLHLNPDGSATFRRFDGETKTFCFKLDGSLCQITES